MFAQLRSPWWHVPLPLLTRETDPSAALWREHLANRERMVRDLREATGARDVPWSSSRRLLGVALTSLTFGLWIVAGVASLAAFALGGPRTRSAIAAYYAAALLLPPVRFRPGWYRYACALEVGRENGWKLLVKGFRDATIDGKSDPRGGARPLLFCSHPHGLFCAGVSLNLIFSRAALERLGVTHVRLFVHSLLASAFPIVKDWLRALGFLPAVAREMRRCLERGEHAAIVPGGVKEVVWAGRVDEERIALRHAFGFVKVAIQTGAALVPVYTFGESLSCGPDFAPWFDARRRWTYRLEAPIRYLSLCQRWLLPFPNGRLVTVVGDAIDLGPREERPSRERVAEAHGRYCEKLLELIEETKEEAGYGGQVTVLV